MKKILLIVLIILAGCSPLKGIVSPEFTVVKANADVNAVKMQVESLKNDLAVVKGSLDANAQAVAGVNNEVKKMSAGRDMTNTTTSTNDTKLMMYVVKGLVGLCTTLIGILGWCLKTLVRNTKEKKFFKEKTLLYIQNKEELKNLKIEEEEFVKTNGYRKSNKKNIDKKV